MRYEAFAENHKPRLEADRICEAKSAKRMTSQLMVLPTPDSNLKHTPCLEDLIQ